MPAVPENEILGYRRNRLGNRRTTISIPFSKYKEGYELVREGGKHFLMIYLRTNNADTIFTITGHLGVQSESFTPQQLAEEDGLSEDWEDAFVSTQYDTALNLYTCVLKFTKPYFMPSLVLRAQLETADIEVSWEAIYAEFIENSISEIINSTETPAGAPAELSPEVKSTLNFTDNVDETRFDDWVRVPNYGPAKLWRLGGTLQSGLPNDEAVDNMMKRVWKIDKPLDIHDVFTVEKNRDQLYIREPMRISWCKVR